MNDIELELQGSDAHSAANAIAELFHNRSASIGVIGLGYVGLPLLCTAAERGFSVVGFDIDSTKIGQLVAGESYFQHISPAKIVGLRETGRFDATTEFSRLRELDCLEV